MASELFSYIQSLSTKLLEAIRGTTSTSQQQDPASPVSNRNESIREDLEKVSRMLARIQAIQQDAEEREIHDRSVRLWLAELRGVAYQAEDVLDEFYYEVLRSIVESGDAAIEAYHTERGIYTITFQFWLYMKLNLKFDSKLKLAELKPEILN